MQFELSSKEKRKLRDQLCERYGRRCYYCGIEEKEFFTIWGEFYGGKRRGSTLEIDRKNNKQGYDDIENCVLACALCNMAKSDKFDYEEFKRVGDVIREIWQRKSRVVE